MSTARTATGDPSGTTYRLRSTDRLDMQGGQAVIFTVVGNHDLLAKIFNGPPDPVRERKLRAMLRFTTLGASDLLSWPVELLRDGGHVVGYLMRRATGCLLGELARSGSAIRYLDRICVAGAVADGLRAIHDAGVVVGDLNPNNIMVDVRKRRIVFIDTDSFQVREPDGTVLFCPVFMEDYTAPELLVAGNIPRTVRRPEHDLFALGVLVFWLLALRAPHDFTGPGTTPEKDRIRVGDWAHSRRRGGTKVVPLGGIPWEAFSSPMQELFHACFDDGHQDPSRRPAAWIVAETVNEFGRELVKASRRVWRHPSATATLSPARSQRPPRPRRPISLSLRAFDQAVLRWVFTVLRASPALAMHELRWWPLFVLSFLLTTGRLAFGATWKFLVALVLLCSLDLPPSAVFGGSLALHAFWELLAPGDATDLSHPAGMGWLVAIGAIILSSAIFLWAGMVPV